MIPFGERRLPERSETSKRMHGAVLHAHVLTLALLLLFETHGKGATDGMREPLAACGARGGLLERVLGGEEAVAQPAPRRAITAYVCKAGVVVSIGRTERDLFYRLIH